MTSHDDDGDQAETARRTAKLYVATVAVPIAIRTAVEICENRSAPAAARAAAANALLRAGAFGGFGRAGEDDGARKEPHEMSGDELQRHIERLRAEAAARARPVLDVEPAAAKGSAGSAFD